MEYRNLGEKIKEARLEKGYTQEKLGEKIESTGSYIGQIERGERNASVSKIIAILNALNISVDYLLGNLKPTCYNTVDNDVAELLQGITNTQKQMIRDIIKIVKKYK